MLQPYALPASLTILQAGRVRWLQNYLYEVSLGAFFKVACSDRCQDTVSGLLSKVGAYSQLVPYYVKVTIL